MLSSKYYDFETGLFTKEIDIKSAIFLYFVDVFGINLASVNRLNPYTGQIVTLDEIFSIINLQDVDIKQKVWKLYQQSVGARGAAARARKASISRLTHLSL